VTLPFPPQAIIFDFDGVILDSAGLKVDAYVTIYADEDPAKVQQLVRHAHLHGGTTRRTKFAQYEKELFGRSGDAESVERLSQRYTQLVLGAVLRSAFIAGAQALLAAAKDKVDMHVVSGTPDEELRLVIAERDLAPFFKTVWGAPATKVEAFGRILRDHRYEAARVVAIGDSMTEFWAAEALGIPFLGIANGSAASFPARVPTEPTLQNVGALLGITDPPKASNRDVA
jgi:phosphoglycolate phosphatase-like HAD superfamily hydrolase